jgi:GGDEF domain-containing protein
VLSQRRCPGCCANARAGDLAARLGGDEFAILTRNAVRDAALRRRATHAAKHGGRNPIGEA